MSYRSVHGAPLQMSVLQTDLNFVDTVQVQARKVQSEDTDGSCFTCLRIDAKNLELWKSVGATWAQIAAEPKGPSTQGQCVSTLQGGHNV